MMRLGAARDRQRQRATAYTTGGGAWWLAATACGAAASTTGCSFLAFSAMTVIASFFALAILLREVKARGRLEREQQRRTARVDALERATLDGARKPLSVAEQLEEWSSNPDLLVYAQIAAGRMRMTFRGGLYCDRSWTAYTRPIGASVPSTQLAHYAASP